MALFGCERTGVIKCYYRSQTDILIMKLKHFNKVLFLKNVQYFTSRHSLIDWSDVLLNV